MTAPALPQANTALGVTDRRPAPWLRRAEDLDRLVGRAPIGTVPRRRQWLRARILVPVFAVVLAFVAVSAVAVSASDTAHTRSAQVNAAKATLATTNTALALEQARNVALTNTLDQVNGELAVVQNALAAAHIHP
jgi:hypothetical protein